jgi:hypothetical protein
LRLASIKLSRKVTVALTLSALLTIGILELPKSFKQIVEYRNYRLNLEQSDSRVKVGQWLQENYLFTTRIIYDRYVYIPPSFFDVHATPWRGEEIFLMLKEFNPDLILVEQGMLKDFSDKSLANEYAGGKIEFLEKYDYYEKLTDEHLGYNLLRDFGTIKIYAKQELVNN